VIGTIIVVVIRLLPVFSTVVGELVPALRVLSEHTLTGLTFRYLAIPIHPG